MICKNCNCSIPDTAAFCSNCGTPVDDDLESTGLLVEEDNEVTGLLDEEDEATGLLVENQVDANEFSANEPNFEANDSSVSFVNPAFVNPNVQIQQQFNNYQQTNEENIVTDNKPQNIVAKPTMKECYIKFWQNTANYSDRARRSEYWYVVLMNLIISVVASVTVVGAPLMVLYSIACIPQMLSLIVRRLHDIGKKWYHLFFYLIPIAGPIIILVWLCKDSQVGTNEFGENPKGINS